MCCTNTSPSTNNFLDLGYHGLLNIESNKFAGVKNLAFDCINILLVGPNLYDGQRINSYFPSLEKILIYEDPDLQPDEEEKDLLEKTFQLYLADRKGPWRYKLLEFASERGSNDFRQDLKRFLELHEERQGGLSAPPSIVPTCSITTMEDIRRDLWMSELAEAKYP